jgi:uncharacterized membrane protein YgcG
MAHSESPTTDPVAAAGSRRSRSFAARHGPALAAAVTTLVLLLILSAFLPRRSVDRVPPPPGRWFDDRAGLVSSEFAAAKSTYLQSYLLQVLHLPILVVVEPTVPSGGIEDYTASAANAWKIGAQGADNGVVLFVFPSVRTIRLEVGYGLEGLLPDIEARHLVDATLLPKFAAGRYEDGFEDFFTALVKQLQEHADEAAKADKPIGIVAFAMEILRQVPRLARQAWQLFRSADAVGRVVLALFGATLAAVFGYGLSGVTIGAWALVQLPWRIATGSAWRCLGRQKLAAEFAPAQFVRRPPASLVAVVDELRLGEILWGLLSLAGIVVGIAFLGLGSEAVMGGHGQFSGGGVTEVWPLPAASLKGRP